MNKEKKQTGILKSIQKRLETFPDVSEEYLDKNLYYKEFKFQEDNLEEIVNMLAIIQYTINLNEGKYRQLLDKKLLDAQESLIRACSNIYSERIKLNPKIQHLVQSTIVPYYHGRFEVSFSREISFLPLELRIYIYSNLLSIEASTIRQQYLMDRIALTLHKAGESFLGDVAIFISSWLKSILSELTFRQKLSISSCLASEIKSIHEASKLRERILTDAQMTPEIAGQEFWYGFKGFSKLTNIHNVEAAKICLDIFAVYFEGSFSVVKEIHPLLIEYYKTRNSTKVDKLIKQEGLDEVTIVRRYSKIDLNSNTVEEMELEYSKQIEDYQKLYVEKVNKKYKEFSYLYINPSSPKISKNTLMIPEKISQEEAVIHIENLEHILRFKRITLANFSEYILNLSSSFMNSNKWDLGTLNIIIGSLSDIYGMVWFRNIKDSIPLLRILVKILGTNTEDEIHTMGTGWPVSIIIEDSRNSTITTKNFIIYKSMNQFINSYVGLTYVSQSPLLMSEDSIEDIIRIEQNQQINWGIIEKSTYLTKSMRQKRLKAWKKIRDERNRIITKLTSIDQAQEIISNSKSENITEKNIDTQNSFCQNKKVQEDFSNLPYFEGFIFEGFIDKKNNRFIWRYFINHKINFINMNKANMNNLKEYAQECLLTGSPLMVEGDKSNELWAASHPMQIETAYDEISQIIKQI
ncbi:hypothetical protein [Rossellomorea aquimaris]|uniref:hypothetical protein n=1 Tax=Rossellomorea aquimaris TaxID=189382 RepID=UPI0011E989E6|nr:hypothetical protein [Rossellomorea aquimaris]TYS86227.1 hypothetical protein FZC88_19050 [Rossellomorea aquimaris]